MITVYNKIDAIAPETLALMRARHPEALFISVHTGAGLDRLLARCAELAIDDQFSAELLVPHDRYDIVGKLHQLGTVTEQDTRDDGVFIRGRFPLKQRALFEPFLHVSASEQPRRKPAKKPARTR
jgi:GTP-binding protein HflX